MNGTGSFIPEPTEEIRAFLRECLNRNEEEFVHSMKILGEFLYTTNEQMNLTAIKPDGFWSRHVADSLSVAMYYGELFSGGKRICDLGCGAGFPSLVLAAAFPETEFISVDSTKKKITYVNNAAMELGLKNLQAIHGRGNELARKEPYKRSFDTVFARAVASADILLREGSAFLKKGASLVIYRTREQYEEEIPFLKKWKKGTFSATEVFNLPEEAGSRMFLSIKVF